MEAATSVDLPQYALPDLANMGTSWVFPITKYAAIDRRLNILSDASNNTASTSNAGTSNNSIIDNDLTAHNSNSTGMGYII